MSISHSQRARTTEARRAIITAAAECIRAQTILSTGLCLADETDQLTQISALASRCAFLRAGEAVSKAARS